MTRNLKHFSPLLVSLCIEMVYSHLLYSEINTDMEEEIQIDKDEFNVKSDTNSAWSINF